MDQIVIAMLNALSQGPTASMDALTQTSQEYNSDLYNAAAAIHNTAVKPVTAIILSTFLTLMLYNTSVRADGDKHLAVQMIGKVLIKAALVIVFAAMALTLLQGIEILTARISTAAQATDVQASEAGLALGDAMAGQIENSGTLETVAAFIIVLFPFLAVKLAGIIAVVLIFVRFLQLFMMTTFASIPIALFGHEDTKGAGVGFLRSFAAVALSGALMILAVKFFQAMMGSWTADNVDPSGDVLDFVVDNIGDFFVAPLVLVIVLMKATTVAKSITGAN